MRSQWIWTALVAAGMGYTASAGWAEDSDAGDRLDVGGIEQSGGTIKGTIKFDGRQRSPKSHRVDADKFCAHAHNDEPLLKETYVWGKNGTLQNVFVYISNGLQGTFDPPTQPAVLDQSGCAYVPHVRGIVVKQTLEIRNSDNTLHNVKLTSKKNGKENKGSRQGQVLTKIFKKPEMGVEYQCDVHSWMKAYVHVMSHPFFAVTQADGTYEIQGLPPGEYEVSVWHEFARFAPDKENATVTVSEGETAEIDFTYAPKKKKK